MANVCVSVLGEYKMILRRNNTKAKVLALRHLLVKY